MVLVMALAALPASGLVDQPAEALGGHRAEMLTGHSALGRRAPAPIELWPSSLLAFSWPLPDPVHLERQFDQPAAKWLAGHRGVDLIDGEDAPVLAPAVGAVSYNGLIVDRHVVVITHGDLRSTLEPVVSALPVGTAVQRGQVVGQLATNEAAHCAACLHWGVRLGQDYLDPAKLVGAGARAVLWP